MKTKLKQLTTSKHLYSYQMKRIINNKLSNK